MLEKGAGAHYSDDRLADIPDDLRQRFTAPSEEGRADAQIVTAVRKFVTFKHLNLLNPWPLKQLYDAIFCRNVVIYFDAETKQNLVRKLVQQLKVGGFLYLGHSESLMDPGDAIRFAGHTTYERIK